MTKSTEGWTITQEAATVLSATKPGRRPCKVGGEDGIALGILRQRLFAAMEEADGLAAAGGGQPAAGGGLVGQPATIVVHDAKE